MQITTAQLTPILVALASFFATHAAAQDLAWYKHATAKDPATQAALENCEAQAARLGSGDGPTYIDAGCGELVFRSAPPWLIQVSADQSYAVAARGSLILIRMLKAGPDSDAWISGKNTELARIQSLTLDGAKNEISVLTSKPKRILTFSAKVPGNVAPIRVLDAATTPELGDPRSIAVDSKTGTLALVDAEKASVTLVPRAFPGPAPVVTLSGKKTELDAPTSVAIDSAHGKLFVLESNRRRVLVFSLAAGVLSDQAPEQVIALSEASDTSQSPPRAIAYRASSNRLEIIHEDGTLSRLSLDRSAPQL